MSKYLGTLAFFQTFGHDILNIIVHVLIGGFVICVERCSTMGFLVLIELLRAGHAVRSTGTGKEMHYNVMAADGNYACFRHAFCEHFSSFERN